MHHHRQVAEQQALRLDLVLTEAAALGRETVDLHLAVTRGARASCVTIGALLDAADEVCRDGSYLLTLPTPPGQVALRRWVFAQVVSQLDGGPTARWAGPLRSTAAEK